jgi:hypothetical protein
MENSEKPQFKWRLWVVSGVLLLAVLNFIGAYWFSYGPLYQPEVAYYWPYLFYAHQGLFPLLCLPALAVTLAVILIVRQLQARVRGLSHAAPVVALLGLAAGACFCSYSAFSGAYYQHIASVQTAVRSYQLGSRAEADIWPYADLVLCGCDRLGFTCRCYPVGGYKMRSVTPPHLVPLAAGGVAIYVGDDWLTSWLDSDP